MTISRETIESLYQDYWRCLNAANWDGLLDHFSSDCTFTNSAMQEIIEGKQKLQEIAATWPPVDNFPEWHAIRPIIDVIVLFAPNSVSFKVVSLIIASINFSCSIW